MLKSNISESVRVVSTIDPVSQSATAANGDVIDMAMYDRVLFLVLTGVLGTSATVDFLIKGDTASGGSYATTITGKSITQLVKASHDNSQVMLEVTQADVVAQGFRYIRPTLTVGAAASLVSMVAIGFLKHFASDGTDNDLASVVEIVN